MSRFIEILNDFHGEVDLKNFKDILERMREKLDAEAAHFEMCFPFFLSFENDKGGIDTRNYTCTMHGSADEHLDLCLQIEIPLRKNSHLVSLLEQGEFEYGTITISVRFNHFIWIEDLIMVVEHSMEEGNALALDKKIGPLTLEKMNQLVGEKLREQSALKWFSITTEKKANGFTSFATTQI